MRKVSLTYASESFLFKYNSTLNTSFFFADLTEPFFNTSYTELKFSSQFINPCYEPGSFQFPPPNPFLPTVLPLPAETDDDDDEAGTDDESDLLVDKPNIKLWHSCDESVPTFNLSVLCKIGSDLRSQALGVFYLHLLKESLAPILSQVIFLVSLHEMY